MTSTSLNNTVPASQSTPSYADIQSIVANDFEVMDKQVFGSLNSKVQLVMSVSQHVINAGGIINVALEYLGQDNEGGGSREEVESRIHLIPGRLAEIWAESKASGTPASAVADRMAQKLIGRG